MATDVDLTTASRDVLIAIIARQQGVIERLERQIAELAGRTKPGGPPRMPGIKPKSGCEPPMQKQPRKRRPHGFTRRRMTPTHQVEHVVESCPDCGTQLTGGWVQRSREVIDPPLVPVQVTEHLYIARNCPVCKRRRLPQAELEGVALGRQRLGVNLLSLIATLREEGRLPIRSIQWYLGAVHQLRLSVGAIVGAIHRPAQKAQPTLAEIVDRIRASPVVHADETGWREDGANGYVWTFTTPTERYFLRRGRGKEVVDEALGATFAGTLVSDFYAAYNHYDGPRTDSLAKQRCWAHLLREIHDLVALYPKEASLAQWVAAIHRLYTEAKAFTHPDPANPSLGRQRRAAQLALERRLLANCRPFLADPSAVQARLCRRMERHLKELFVFVAEPEVPPDPANPSFNNAAERSLRHLVVSRKVSGGSRSQRGTESKMALASIFGTWCAQGLNPLAACRQVLVSP